MSFLIFLIILISPSFSFAAAKARSDIDRPDCESRLTFAIASGEQLIEVLEAKSASLSQILGKKTLNVEEFVKTFVEIQNLAKSYNNIPTQPSLDDSATQSSMDDFSIWACDYAIKIEKLTEIFVSHLTDPIPKQLAQKMLTSSADSPYTWVVRLSMIRFAVSHSAFATLDLDRHEKGRLLNEALSIAIALAPHLGSQEAFWGDLYLDLHNWNYLTSPNTLDLLDKIDGVVSKSLDYIGPKALTTPQLRFFFDAMNMALEYPGPRKPHLQNTLLFIDKHKEQLHRMQPRIYEKLTTLWY